MCVCVCVYVCVCVHVCVYAAAAGCFTQSRAISMLSADTASSVTVCPAYDQVSRTHIHTCIMHTRTYVSVSLHCLIRK